MIGSGQVTFAIDDTSDKDVFEQGQNALEPDFGFRSLASSVAAAALGRAVVGVCYPRTNLLTDNLIKQTDLHSNALKKDRI